MPCPHCAAPVTIEQSRRTSLGYPTCRCPACRRIGNERTGTPYNHLHTRPTWSCSSCWGGSGSS